MRKALTIGLSIASLLLTEVAGAQVDLRVETDSIEVAALAYASSHLRSTPRTIVVDSRIRAGRTFARGRSASHSELLARVVHGKVADFGCDNTSPSCRAPDADIGFLLHAPAVKGSAVQITVEIHTRSGMGADTYELARAGKGWYVTRVVSRRVT